jgi:hypothetical protein
MYPSDRFLNRVVKLKKSHLSDSESDQTDLVRIAFEDEVRHLPVALTAELFGEFSADLRTSPGDTVFDRCRRLGDVIDLVCEQYDSENDPLAARDWSIIADLISDHAAELEMRLVTYIMSLAVDHHAL